MNIWRKYSPIALIVFVSVFAIAPAVADESIASYNLVRPPSKPIEILQNVKVAVKYDLFRNDEIMSNDENLWELFSGDQIFRSYPVDENIKGFTQTIYPSYIDESQLDVQTNSYERFNIKAQIRDRYIIVQLNNMSGLKLSRVSVESILGI